MWRPRAEGALAASTADLGDLNISGARCKVKMFVHKNFSHVSNSRMQMSLLHLFDPKFERCCLYGAMSFKIYEVFFLLSSLPWGIWEGEGAVWYVHMDAACALIDKTCVAMARQ